MNIKKYIPKNNAAIIAIAFSVIFFVFCLCCCCILLVFPSDTQRVEGVSNESVHNDAQDQEEEIEVQPTIIYQEESDYYEYNLNFLEGEKLYTLTKIVDGDTIKVNDGEEEITVRLIGIDTPETKDPRKEVQCFGAEASSNLDTLLTGNKVYLVSDDTQDDIDKYDRYLRYVVREDGYFINLNSIYKGYAHEYTYQVPYQFQSEFKEAEKHSSTEKLGLYGQACQCSDSAGEIKRECSSCNTAKVTTKTWDCSESTSKVEDKSCSNLCEVSTPKVQTPTSPAPKQSSPAPSPSYTCNCSKTCNQMSSCSEAYFQLNQCGCGARDGNNDGVPCEDIC